MTFYNKEGYEVKLKLNKKTIITKIGKSIVMVYEIETKNQSRFIF